MTVDLVVPADVKRQMDDLHEAAPFKSSTVRFQEDVEAIEAVAESSEEDDSNSDDSDSDSDRYDDDKDDNERADEDSSSITATTIATASSLSQQLDVLEAEQQQLQQDPTAAPDALLRLSDSNDHEDGALVPSSSDSSLIHMFTDDASFQEGDGGAADAAAAGGTKDQGRRQEEEYQDLLQALDSMFASKPSPSAPPKE